jgi:hypothetical protein
MSNQIGSAGTAYSQTTTPSKPLNHRADLQPAQDAIDYLKAYARERPEVAALWCFGIGFVLGWKLKPW